MIKINNIKYEKCSKKRLVRTLVHCNIVLRRKNDTI